METLCIDPEAKTKVELTKIDRDKFGHPYYIGKLQFPGTLEFEGGVSFMVFVSEEGYEELQIAPLDPARRNKSNRNGAGLSGGRFSIDLHPMIDQNGKIYYVGEAMGLVEMKLRKGIFFTIFVSREGQEEIQISRLNHKVQKKQTRPDRDVPVEVRRGWPPRLEETVT
jgi:hypothetical protein